jgi:hypothetical protein
MEWRRGDARLRPGDIILTHFGGWEPSRGSMTDVLRVVLETASSQGFAVARLEDYL